ncbi:MULTISPECIES: 8-amino-7-oxononanoate synthase [unclassified Thermoactinomyces]|uniref:8-amino-7-oxononanoate synthase n=1 Tax=unclassified Thermoactinomyces TaxID=2634588 RepID=UPI0018DE6DE7|nr:MULTISPECIES: 8-amino-7-oxononanoate synthase [unclassified Thermoactinomyces]MBH8598471.1 8-amino-7-oxononanoate synthase [Thermoactinomyces sp. CICC 10523]MBH8604684.1 8-amino-7-oxononanoate synthase [Thermoactinomyces sp. CICC 10522]MBH8606855.1 8-amino-7-oxononanoate synthase [Thermoactinomyces sp. CICC 10521]
MSSLWNRTIREELQALSADHLNRHLIPTADAHRPVLHRKGKRLVNFSSNNYLGLAGHPRMIQAMREAAEKGSGAGSSRLIIGHSEEAEALEQELAAFKGTESAVLFPNGYMANAGLLSAFLKPSDAVFSDQWNHASIVDGIRMSKARKYIYRHLDPDHLESLLKTADQQGAGRKLIVTDTVFSMDGDVAPLRDLVELKKRYDAALVVDDAHGGGVFGDEGKGMAHELGVDREIDLYMGTFSKAFGVYGAYVAGKRDWIRYLINKCRPFIYTTALPPVIIAGIRASLRLVRDADRLRRELRQKSGWFRRQLTGLGLDVAGSATQIIPVVVGENEQALLFSHRLQEQGVLSVAIRPPTVPAGTARLRFSLMANHREEDLRQAIEAIKLCCFA